MKNKDGYTIVELIIVIVVIGIFAFVTINKASYAFSDNTEVLKELEEQKTALIETAALKYAKEHKEVFGDANKTYIRVSDLIKENYLLLDADGNVSGDSNINKSQKIALTLKDEKVTAHLEK